MKKGTGMQAGMTRKNPPQQASGSPKPASSYPSVDSDADRKGTAPSPKTLGGRTA